MNTLKIVVKVFYIFFKTGNARKAFFFSALKGGSNLNLMAKFSLTKNSVTHKGVGRSIQVNHISSFNNDLSLLDEAFERFSLEEIQGKIFMSILKHGKRLTLQINSFDGWGAFYEILVKDAYEISVKDETVVIDVGMNVGTAALFFATYDNVKKVYGFEPVPSSCAMAEENFRLNEIASKIHFDCAALGKGEKRIMIPESFGGGVGVSVTDFVMKRIYKVTDYKNQIEVLVKDASTNINSILQRHTEKIFLKLDCEGAEYEIVQDLFEQGLLQRISFIIMEWHYNGKEVLVEKLIQAGFVVFAPDLAVDFPAGFIYGVNSNSFTLSE